LVIAHNGMWHIVAIRPCDGCPCSDCHGCWHKAEVVDSDRRSLGSGGLIADDLVTVGRMAVGGHKYGHTQQCRQNDGDEDKRCSFHFCFLLLMRDWPASSARQC